ncbi:MAG: DUF4411 family protein [Elusimicrobiota bacterium]|jgi:predicted nucleic acid-binding protein|nr:DUF4411 family protein [Elusimicrobiota bacterium]
MKYCLDSNVFINAWRQHYSPEISMDFWTWFANLARNKEIFVPEEVYEEIENGKDGLFKWIKTLRSDIVYSLDVETQNILVEVIMKKPEAIKLADSNSKKNKNGADVFIAAYAKRHMCPVVSNDTGLRELCKVCGVEVLRDHEFFKAKKLKMNVIL